jgi:hypothetical protein
MAQVTSRRSSAPRRRPASAEAGHQRQLRFWLAAAELPDRRIQERHQPRRIHPEQQFSRVRRAGNDRRQLCRRGQCPDRLRDERGRVAEANAAAASYLFAKVKEGNVTAQIFWMKTRAGWREGRAPEDPVPGAEAGSNLHVVILPDNGRDPELTKELLKAQEKYHSRKRRRFDE